MSSNIIINTKTLLNEVDNLNAIDNYYQRKQSSFASNGVSSNTKINAYIGKITENYKYIAKNIKTVRDYIDDLARDTSGIENQLSGSNGVINESIIAEKVRKIKGTINKYEIIDEQIFKSTRMANNNFAQKTNKSMDRNGALGIFNSHRTLGKAFNHDSYGNRMKHGLGGDFNTLHIDNVEYNEALEQYQQILKDQQKECEIFISDAEEQLAKYNSWNATYNQIIQNMWNSNQMVDANELSDYILSRMPEDYISQFSSNEEAIENLASLSSQIGELNNYIRNCKQTIKAIEDNATMGNYDCLFILEDFNNYTYSTEEVKFTKELITGTYGSVPSLKYSWDEDVNPALLAMKMLETGSDEFAVLGQLERIPDCDEELILNMLKTVEYDETYIKTYSYLYENYGIKKANAYLEAAEFRINQVVGAIEAAEFTSSLSTDDGIISAVGNTVKVKAEGLKNGLIQFGEGVTHAFSALGSLVGIEPDTTTSVAGYKSSYILAGGELDFGDNTLKVTGLNSDEYSGVFLDNIYEINTSIGNMAPSMLLSIINPALGTAAMGVSSGGNSYHSALQQGYSNSQACLYGVVSGASETLTEKFLGGIPLLSDVKVTGIKTWLGSMAKEGTEEAFQEVCDSLLRSVVFGEEIDVKELGPSMVKSAIYGALTAGELQSVNAISGTINSARVNSALNNGIVSESDIREVLNTAKTQNPNLEINVDNLSTKQIIQNYSSILMRTFSPVIKVAHKIQTLTYQSNIKKQISDVNKSIRKGDTIIKPIIVNDINDLTLELISKLERPNNVVFEINGEQYLYRDVAGTLRGKQIINKALNVASKNEVALKLEILNTISSLPDNVTDIDIARKLYIELNERLHYSTEMNMAPEEVEINIIEEARHKEINFSNLEGLDVICKGWSELYLELLQSAGFDAKILTNKNNGHWWVQINVGDEIIVADATDGHNHSNDLTRTKGGYQTCGFMILDKGYNGSLRPSVIFKNENNQKYLNYLNERLKSIDTKIGYATADGLYYNEILNQVNSYFGDNSSNVNELNLFNMDIPSSMNGHEAWLYFRQALNIMTNNDSKFTKTSVSYIYDDVNQRYISQCIVEYNNPETGEYRTLTYDETNGTHIFDSLNKYQDYCIELREREVEAFRNRSDGAGATADLNDNVITQSGVTEDLDITQKEVEMPTTFLGQYLNHTARLIPTSDLELKNEEVFNALINMALEENGDVYPRIYALEEYIKFKENNSIKVEDIEYKRLNIINTIASQKLRQILQNPTIFYDYLGKEYRLNINDCLNDDSLAFIMQKMSITEQIRILATIENFYSDIRKDNIYISRKLNDYFKKYEKLYLEKVNLSDSLLSKYSTYGVRQNSVRETLRTDRQKVQDLIQIVRKNIPDISKKQAYKFLNIINNTGACSYAAVLNEILVIYNNNPQQFKSDFGFDLYSEENGAKILNDAGLLADFYSFVNSDNNEMLGKKWHGYKIKDDSNQICLSGAARIRDDIINAYLKYHGVSTIIEHTNIMNMNDIIKNAIVNNTFDTEEYKDHLEDVFPIFKQVLSHIFAEGRVVQMSIYPLTDKPITFQSISKDYKSVCTSSWDEGDGHSILAVGMTEYGVIVSSWGKKYVLSWEDLKKCGFVARECKWR